MPISNPSFLYSHQADVAHAAGEILRSATLSSFCWQQVTAWAATFRRTKQAAAGATAVVAGAARRGGKEGTRGVEKAGAPVSKATGGTAGTEARQPDGLVAADHLPCPHTEAHTGAPYAQCSGCSGRVRATSLALKLACLQFVSLEHTW